MRGGVSSGASQPAANKPDALPKGVAKKPEQVPDKTKVVKVSADNQAQRTDARNAKQTEKLQVKSGNAQLTLDWIIGAKGTKLVHHRHTLLVVQLLARQVQQAAA